MRTTREQIQAEADAHEAVASKPERRIGQYSRAMNHIRDNPHRGPATRITRHGPNHFSVRVLP